MTPGAWLCWDAAGCHHAHSDEEASLPAEMWRPGASCNSCPHKAAQDDIPWATSVQPLETVVQRKPGGDTHEE